MLVISITAFIIYRKARGSNAYQQMLAAGRQYLPDGFPQWLIDAARSKEIANLTRYYLIKGKATDASYLLAAYDQQYAGRGYQYKSGAATRGADGGYTGDEKALHSTLHKILQTANAQ